MIFNFENKNVTWQEVSISMKPPNCTAKGFFVGNQRKLSSTKWNLKKNKQILDAEYKKINQKSIIMNLNYLKVKQKINSKKYFRNMKKYLMEP